MCKQCLYVDPDERLRVHSFRMIFVRISDQRSFESKHMFIKGTDNLETKVDPCVPLMDHDLDHSQSRSRSSQMDALKLKKKYLPHYRNITKYVKVTVELQECLPENHS